MMNRTKPLTIIVVVIMIVALAGWILQWQLADDEVADEIGIQTQEAQ